MPARNTAQLVKVGAQDNVRREMGRTVLFTAGPAGRMGKGWRKLAVEVAVGHVEPRASQPCCRLSS